MPGMATGKPNSVETTKPSLRKRRAASLVAEALWNIQMEEDVSGKLGLKMKSASQSPGTALKVSTTEKRCNSSKGRKPCGSTSSRKNTKACVHLPVRPRKVSHTNMAVEKPMASVVPVVKSESSPPNCAEKRLRNGASAGNSQVLLFPISINPGVSAAVPVLALHPSSVNADFISCLNASTLVNVGPILTGSTVRHAQQSTDESHTHQMRHLESPQASEAILGTFRGNEVEVADQTEPLNLKLGESSIPSGEFHSALAEKVPAGKCLGNSTLIRQEERTFRILPTCHNYPYRAWKDGSSATSKISKDVQWIQANENSTFIAYSPSSESSSSTDPDDASGTLKKPRGRRKINISLRSKAASPGQAMPFGTSNRKSVSSQSSDNNGWIWDGEAYNALVHSVETGEPVVRRCYPSMRRKSESHGRTNETGEDDLDDVVMVRDCVIMRADGGEQPYVAKIAALWQQPLTGKMMISLLWFYRPEHTEDARVLKYLYNDDELFASRHLDEISVECVEDKCYVLTYNQYCRYIATSERTEAHVGAVNGRNLVPALLRRENPHTILLPGTNRSLVYFCRKLYDIKSQRLLKTFPPPTTLFYANFSQ